MMKGRPCTPGTLACWRQGVICEMRSKMVLTKDKTGARKDLVGLPRLELGVVFVVTVEVA